MSSCTNPSISLIAALADNRVIGVANRLPWHLPADLQHFKQLTLGKPIMMGRKTWESLPGLLPQRPHIVLTRRPGYQAPGCQVASSVEQALALARPAPEVMVVGGAALYTQLLPLAQRLYLTLVHTHPEGDTLFPDYDPGQWRVISRTERPADENNRHACTFLTLERVSA